jgi:MerR family transcriptional regulator, copper efflux regulator
MLIGELAQRGGVSIHTIRFYEKQGLLDESHLQRGENSYRHYNESALERLMLIQRGQAAGFTLSEMRLLIGAWEAGELTIDDQQALVRQKLDEITRKIAQLEEMRLYLEAKQVVLTEERAAQSIPAEA